MPGGRIFISYRRGVDNGVTGRLHDRLERHFDRDQLFIDVDAIPLGRDFVTYLDEQIARCEAFIAVIGPGWLDEIQELRGKDDFVRIELEAVLKRPGIPIIPVLVDGAKMPEVDDLPETLHPLLRRNGILIDHHHFAQTVDGKLTAALREIIGEPEADNLVDPDFISATGEAMHLDHPKAALTNRSLIIGAVAVIAAAFFFWAGTREIFEDQASAPAPSGPVEAPDAYQPPVATELEGEIELNSAQGDWVGDGVNRRLSDADGNISATTDGNNISVSYDGDDDWSLEFAAPEGQVLAVQDYPNATRYPFNSPKKPGLSISGEGRGCNQVEGRFSITDLRFDAAVESLLRLELEFEQSCDGGPPLTGSVRVREID